MKNQVTNKAPLKVLDLIMTKTNKVLKETEKEDLKTWYDILTLYLKER